MSMAKRYRTLVFAFLLAVGIFSLFLAWQPIASAEPPHQQGPTAVSLVADPYIGVTTPTSVVVAWAADGSASGEVHYSTNTSYGQVATATSFSRDGKYWYSATITGLTPGTTYHYRVYLGGTDVTPWSDVTFHTAPSTDTTQVVFAGLGDSRPDEDDAAPNPAAYDVANQMAQHSYAFGIHTGDIVHDGSICSGSDSGWNQYLRAYFDVYDDNIKQNPLFTAIGNHEEGYNGYCGYTSYTDVYYLPENAPSGHEEEYYSFDWGNIHVVVLDTEQDYEDGSTQNNWLKNDLQNTDRRWIVAAFHKPAYSSGPHGSKQSVQDEIVPVLEYYGVDVVLNGHDHSYERTCPIKDDACTTIDDGGVVYFVTGGAGAPLYGSSGDWFTAKTAKKYHFLLFNVNDCQMDITAIDEDGDTFDTLTINKCLGNFAPASDIGITGGDDVQLSWQHVTKDSNNKDITVVKYYVYRDTAPYQGDSATQVAEVTGPFSTSNPVTWTDANRVGDASTNYFYYVRSVVMDGQKEVLSELSNHTGEFDFALVKGN